MATKSEFKEKNGAFKPLFNILKAMFVSLIITFACIILFAFVIKWSSLSDNFIRPVNLCIKAISILFGILVLNKNSGKKMIKGVVFAILYTVISFAIFSCLAGTLILGLGLVSDFLFNIVVGVIASILSAIGKNN